MHELYRPKSIPVCKLLESRPGHRDVDAATHPTLACAQVQTIDQCQGDEADAVVLSLVLAYTLPSGTAPRVAGKPPAGRMEMADSVVPQVRSHRNV